MYIFIKSQLNSYQKRKFTGSLVFKIENGGVVKLIANYYDSDLISACEKKDYEKRLKEFSEFIEFGSFSFELCKGEIIKFEAMEQKSKEAMEKEIKCKSVKIVVAK